MASDKQEGNMNMEEASQYETPAKVPELGPASTPVSPMSIADLDDDLDDTFTIASEGVKDFTALDAIKRHMEDLKSKRSEHRTNVTSDLDTSIDSSEILDNKSKKTE